MDIIESIYRLKVPDNQKLMVLPTHNRDPIGDTINESLHLDLMLRGGWKWVGQKTRHWYVEGRDEYEFLDVFERVEQTSEDS